MSSLVSKSNYNMSTDMALGIYDADGSVLSTVDYPRNGTGPIYFRILYYFGQSLSKRDTVEKFANLFGGQVLSSSGKAYFRVDYKSDVGKRFRAFLAKNKPLHPGRLRDYLISEQSILILEKNGQKTKEGLVMQAYLSYNITKMRAAPNSRKWSLQDCIDYINPSPLELAATQAKITPILEEISKKVQKQETLLLHTVFSLDYIRGAHFGDGSFCVGLTWSPNKNDRRRTEADWVISGENQAYCQALADNLSGNINMSGSNCYIFILTGMERCQAKFYIFDTSPWMPAYKRTQLETFKKAIQLLQEGRHMTKEGTIELVNIVYDMSEKGKRKYRKEQYIRWGLDWLKRRNV